MTRVAVIGATGYTGGELLRLLQCHPELELCAVSSRERAGTAVSDLFPSLRGHVDLRFRKPQEVMAETVDFVCFATPHGVAMHSAAELLDRGVRVIDLSADFRIKDVALWERWYNNAHAAPELVQQAVYGLPEINREAIARARLVAVPGCYPTAVQLGFLPLLEQGLVEPGLLIADVKSGVSGAGRKAVEDYLLCETSESIRAYGVSGHRHHPEICQGLAEAAGSEVGLTFVPHLTPMIRGILATLYSPLKSGSQVTATSLQDIFEDRYATDSFVDVLPANSLPATRDVSGSNRCALSANLSADGRMVVVVAAIDNLIKGAAGQAVQSLNIMLGLNESTGLDGIPSSP